MVLVVIDGHESNLLLSLLGIMSYSYSSYSSHSPTASPAGLHPQALVIERGVDTSCYWVHHQAPRLRLLLRLLLLLVLLLQQGVLLTLEDPAVADQRGRRVMRVGQRRGFWGREEGGERACAKAHTHTHSHML